MQEGQVRELVLGMIGLTRLLTSGIGESDWGLSMPGGPFLVYAGVGVLLFWSCIVFFAISVNSNELGGTDLPTRWCGLLVPCLRDVGFCMHVVRMSDD